MKIIFGVVEENGKRVRKHLALEPRECLVCGESFEPETQSSKYCSRKCAKRADYEKNKELYKTKTRTYYKNNIEHCRKKRKSYYWSDPEKFREKTREYNRLHKQEKNNKDNIYKDKIRHGSRKKDLINEFGCKCSMCGKEDSTFNIIAHHVSFDKNDHDNQILLCRSCHMKVHGNIEKYNITRVTRR